MNNLKSKYMLVFTIVGIILFPASNLVYANDIISYGDLYGLEINAEIPDWLSESKSVKLITKPDKIIYTLESTDFSHPHIFHTSPDGKLIFMQLTIPIESMVSTNNYLKHLGIAPVNTHQSKAETLYGYPELGLSFIIDQYSNNAIRVQKYSPTTNGRLLATYGANYVPVDAIKDDVNNRKYLEDLLKYILPLIITLIVITILTKLLKKSK